MARELRPLGVVALLLSACGGEAPPATTEEAPLPELPSIEVADAAALARAVEPGTPVRIQLAAGRIPVGALVLSGQRLELRGAGVEATELVGPIRFSECSDCRLENLTVRASSTDAPPEALVTARGGSLTLADLRLGAPADGVATGVLAAGTGLRLERVWSAGRERGVRTSEGGSVAVRHSIFESLLDVIERDAASELVLVDNLFADVEACVVRDTVPDRETELNTLLGNVYAGEEPRVTDGAACLALPLLSPAASDATPVLLELEAAEALGASPALALLRGRDGSR